MTPINKQFGATMRAVKTFGLLGTGVIGGGWAARALHFGFDVIAADVKPEMESWIRGAIENAEPALNRLTSAPLPPKGRLSFTTNLNEMAKKADFIQENIPENVELKQRILGQISHHASPDVIIASSTSGIMPSDLQKDMQHPERLIVGHPFNPVYLLPLVELVKGQKTTDAAIEAAAHFYTQIGMHPLRVRKEIPGHLTDRLQEALWREILHLVNDGVATTGELDESIVYGPGLRWAAMGTNQIYHLAGGEPGMRHMLHQFGPCLKWPWTKLEAPELTETLIDRMVEGTAEQAGGRSIRELERLRDDYLVAIQQVLRQFNIGAGSTLRALEERLYAEQAARAPQSGGNDAQPLILLDTAVRPDWLDYNNHLSDFRYAQLFGDAVDVLLRKVGIDDAYRQRGHAPYTVEVHIKHLKEVKQGDSVQVHTQILHLDEKKMIIFHRMQRQSDKALVATCEQLFVHVDTAAQKSTPFAASAFKALESIWQAHSKLPRPAEAGSHIRHQS